jgi:hypothetical protein
MKRMVIAATIVATSAMLAAAQPAMELIYAAATFDFCNTIGPLRTSRFWCTHSQSLVVRSHYLTDGLAMRTLPTVVVRRRCC